MQEILFEYELKPTTWAYLSALLTIGIFFKFHRFWSIRNLDLIGLIVLSPGILLIYKGFVVGYDLLFAVGAFFMIRLLLDPLMVRRPLLEPNLNASGLTFTGTAILVFLAANLLAAKPDRLEHVLVRQHIQAGQQATAIRSPGYVKLYQLASYSNIEEYPPGTAQSNAAQAVALLSLLALVLGIVVVGYRHFDNMQTGVAAASLYLLLPYAGQMTGRIDHLLPAALLVWAVAAYRRPLIAGVLTGLAGGLIFYPLFLLPLWGGFYGRRGLARFVSGVVFTLLILVVLLLLFSGSAQAFGSHLRQMFGGTLFSDERAAGSG